MLTELKRGLVFTAVMMALMGGAYHGLVWAIGRAAFPGQAEGSLIRRADGTIAGSRLVAQKFTREEYFRSRPSASDWPRSRHWKAWQPGRCRRRW
jgi:K+-transporting ATPase ATPase C chain